MDQGCSIRGRVESTSGEPLRKVEVAAGNHEADLRYMVMTDAGGAFAFEGIEPGQYHLEARRTGYVAARYGAGDDFGPPLPLTLAPGRELADIVFRLAPQAVLTGGVTDEDGDPLEGVHVSLLREADLGNGRQLLPRSGSPAASDDRGEFRISGIPAGTWFLCASFGRLMRRRHRGAIRQGGDEAYPDLYYPDTFDADEAQRIRIAAGAELSGFVLRLRKTAAYRVRGSVELPPDADRHTIWVHLAPRFRTGILMFGNRADVHGKPDFEIAGILPGQYTLRASCHEGCVARQTELDLEVTDHDLEGLVLRFPEGADVRGILRGLDDPSGIHVSLTDLSRHRQTAGAVTGRDGTFALSQVSPGSYRIHLWHHPEGSYLKSLRYGGAGVSPRGVAIADPAGGAVLEIEMGREGAVVSGVVEGPHGKPFAGAAVWLSADAEPDDVDHFAIADQDGRFEIRGIAPGSYRVAAAEHARVQRPEAREPLTLAAGECRVLALRVNAIQ